VTGSWGGQPGQHWKGGLCRWQCCSLDYEQGLGEWALWYSSRECDDVRWLLAAGSWDWDWRCSNCPWGSFDVLVHTPRQHTVARLCIYKSVGPSATWRRSSESPSRHLTPWKHLSRGWYNPARHLFNVAPWMASKFQCLFPCLPFASLQVQFSGQWLWPLPFSQLAWVRNHLWWSEIDTRRLPCSSILNHREIYIEHTYRITIMPVCTRLCDSRWDAERGFLLVETRLQLQAGTGSFPSPPSHSIVKLPHMTWFLVWGCGKRHR